MAFNVTYQGDARRSEPSGSGLFAGQKLWFSLAVPSRSYLIDQAVNNGAQVVQRDTDAEIKLVDHMKKSQASGAYSYQYVEQSIRNARLENLEEHRVSSGARVDRPVGSVITASKGSRNKFTEADDQLLWNWLKPYVDGGGMWRGNEIYKHLERLSPNHTYQSWRDRWKKYTQHQKRQITAHVDPFDRIDDEVEANPRSPKRQKVEGHAKQQQANISLPQSRQVLVQDQKLIHPVMGNTSSISDSLEARIDKVHSELKKATTNRPEPGLELKVDSEAHAEDQVAEEETQVVLLGDSSSETSDEVSSRSSQDELNGVKPEVLRDGEDGVSADGSRLPLLFNFTQKEAHMLYKATCHILDGRPDKLDESWAGVAKEHGHTKDAWKKFFYEAIVPEYMHRNGIENEAQLEVHYKAKVREDRVRKAAEKRKREAAEACAVPLRRDEGNEELSNEGPDVTQIQASGEDQMSKDESLRETAEHRDMSRRSVTPPSSIQYRLPKPNESRKLSQPRGSQSTSSQSKSTPTSQPAHVQQPLLHEVQGITVGVMDTTLRQNDTRTHENDCDPSPKAQSEGEGLLPKKQQGETPKLDTAFPSFLRPLKPSQSVQPSQETTEDKTQFVTQQSTREDSISTDTTGLEDIPFRDPASPIQRFRPESPLFVPEEPERLTSELESDSIPDTEEEDRVQSNPPIVQLVDGADVVSDGILTSEYAPSEAPSEGVQFESQIRLSQAWETAPDGRYIEETAQVLDQDHLERQATSALDHDPPLTSNITVRTNDSQPGSQATENLQEESTEGDFETAPSGLRIERSPSLKEDEVIEMDSETDSIIRNALNTQALFRRPTQVAFTDIIAIPEPPGGWDDEEIQTPTRKEVADVSMNTHAAEDADWILLPLPNPDLDQPDTTPLLANDSEAIDMDEWLANQSKTYPAIPNMILKPLSHQALEITSMNFDLADAVLTRMVQRFEKGKLPADRSLQGIRKLPKKERKTAISKIVGELVPDDMRGCWTREDDEALLGVNGREVKRVEDKHGEDGVRSRFEFLELWHAG